MTKVIARTLSILLGVAVITLLLSLGYRSLKQADIRAAIHINSPNGIASLDEVELNGLKQTIKLRGHDVGNPVLLYLHGGPGMPEMAMSHLFDLEIEQHFTVVHWDQRASGKTRRQGFKESDLTVPVFKQDAVALIMHLRERFEKDKIYLVGHSWGSMLGTLVARDHPELLHAYIGIGQISNLTDNEIMSLDYTRRRAREDGNHSALAELEGLNPPYIENVDQLQTQRKWLYYYGGGLRNLRSFTALVEATLTSPDYSILDLIALAQSGGIAAIMWPEMATYDLEKVAAAFKIPVYFLAGRYDYNTPSQLAQRYFENLKAPRKSFIWFEDSAHMMNISDPARYQDVIIKTVLQETRGAAKPPN